MTSSPRTGTSPTTPTSTPGSPPPTGASAATASAPPRPTTALRVVVVGGGIGGLALAAGLRRSGVDVVVHDRDTDPAATGGYHLTLDTAAQRALRELLDPGPGGRARATFADGTTAEGDLLVGADGAHSLVARHLAGHATSRPAGIVGVSGRTPAAALDPAEAARLAPRSSLAVGLHGTALYAGYLDPASSRAPGRWRRPSPAPPCRCSRGARHCGTARAAHADATRCGVGHVPRRAPHPARPASHDGRPPLRPRCSTLAACTSRCSTSSTTSSRSAPSSRPPVPPSS